MTTKLTNYRMFLLTVWKEQNPGDPESVTPRFRLEDARSGRQQFFTDATSLVAALHATTFGPEEAEVEIENEE